MDNQNDANLRIFRPQNKTNKEDLAQRIAILHIQIEEFKAESESIVKHLIIAELEKEYNNLMIWHQNT